MIVLCVSNHLLTTHCLPLTLMLYNILFIISCLLFVIVKASMRPDHLDTGGLACSIGVYPQPHLRISNFIPDGREP